MGCLFSSSPSEEGDRHRKNPQPEQSSIPPPRNESAPETTSPTLNIGPRNPNANKNAQNSTLNRRVLGTSFTDRQQREKQNFNNIVQQARSAFIDISAQQRTQVSPLSPQALVLTAQCEELLSNEPVNNLRNGFFESKTPNTIFTSIDSNPNSTNDNSLESIVNAILEPTNFQVLELAFLCAQEACLALVEGTVPLVQNSLIITQAEFEEN